MPLVHGEGPLTAENGFDSQADVVIEARRAADLLGATPMDRPEDVQPNAMTGKVYVMLTNNTDREPGDENAANPRADNAFGHIIEISETDGDFASTEIRPGRSCVKCGDPAIAEVGATFSAATTENGWFGMPDNCAIDADGRLWVSTDGNSLDKTGRADGLWAVDTEGPARGTSQLFFRVPVGAEMCGPYFTGSGETLFLAVQHPGDEGLSTFEAPATRWPDFSDTLPSELDPSMRRLHPPDRFPCRHARRRLRARHIPSPASSTAPNSPDAAMLEDQAREAFFTAEFVPDLRGEDLLHWAKGTVSVTPARIVHEGELAPGPDYKLYLVDRFVEHEDEFLPIKDDARLIGDVKTFEGFIVDVPDGVDVANYTTVLIWCEAFSEFIGAAQYR